jgi:hypothetical protein
MDKPMPDTDPKRAAKSARANAIKDIKRQLCFIPGHSEIFSKIGVLRARHRTGTINPDTARADVLVAVGLLEYGLSVAIESFLVVDDTLRRKLFDGDHEREGIIGSFYSRSLVARALNVYGDNTLYDISSVRVIRNLCAHAKNEIDLTSEKLRPLTQFHSTAVINEAMTGAGVRGYGPSALPTHALMQFLMNIVPYLLLHSSADWDIKNRSQWRAIFD